MASMQLCANSEHPDADHAIQIDQNSSESWTKLQSLMQGSEEKTEQSTRSSASSPGFSRTVHTECRSSYLGQQVLELIFGERHEESRDGAFQLPLSHRLAVVLVKYLEDLL